MPARLGAWLWLLWLVCAPVPVHAQAHNRVLDLDGQGGNVELPPMIFTNLTEATIECWAKFGTRDETRFYSYGGMQGDLCLGRQWSDIRQIQFFVSSVAMGGKLDMLSVPDDIRIGRWYHVAAVCSSNGMQLHLNGVLVATNDAAKGFHSTTNGPHSIGLKQPFEQLPSFTGQVDEFRVWKVARSGEEIRQTMNQPLKGNEPGLAALWNFDDPAQPGKDVSTNGYHGKLLAGAKTVEMRSPGEQTMDENKVLDLDGSEGTYVELPPNLINHLTNITVEGWVQWRSLGFWSRFFDFGKATTGGFIVTQIRATRGLQLEMWSEGSQGYTPVSEDVLRLNEWIHVAVSADAQGARVYLNGILTATNNVNFTNVVSTAITDNRNLLGRNNWKSGADTTVTDLNGQLDEFRIWSVARSREDLVATMNERLTGREPGLYGLWNFDHVEGPVIFDATTNAHHGRLVGAAKCVAGGARPERVCAP